MSQERLFIYLRERIEWAFNADGKSSALDGNNTVSSGFGSRCLVAPWVFSQTPFVQAVNKLDDHEKTLVKFVVGLTVEEKEVVNMMVPIWFAFYQKYLAFHRLNSSSFPKAQRLLEFALMNYKLSIAQKAPINNQQIMSAIGVSESKYSRDWKPRMLVMNSVIAEIEHVALNKVINCIDNQRRKHA